MKKIMSIFILLLLMGLCVSSQAKDKQASKAQVTESYIQKAKTYLHLVDKSYTTYYEKNDNYKKVATILAQYFSESDLDTMIAFYSTPVFEYYTLKKDKIWAEVDKVILDKKDEKSSGAGKKNKEGASYDACQSELNLAKDDVHKGLSRYKRVCGVNNFPENLDNAQEGEADTDNVFFSRVTSYTRSYDWSKKGNTYTYVCKKTGKKTSLKYDPNNGTFE